MKLRLIFREAGTAFITLHLTACPTWNAELASLPGSNPSSDLVLCKKPNKTNSNIIKSEYKRNKCNEDIKIKAATLESIRIKRSKEREDKFMITEKIKISISFTKFS